MFEVPILFIVFNRPSTTKQVFDAIRKMYPKRLYIASDAPRQTNETDISRCAEVREIVKNVDWQCEVHYLFQEQNLGCSLGPRRAFEWFFLNEEEGIILEDDCLPSRSFFIFCEEMLHRYRSDKRIISINGSNLGYELIDGNSYTYSRFMNMWGWATWRDRAQVIDYDLLEWRKRKNKYFWLWKKLRKTFFDIDVRWINFWRHQFDRTIYNKSLTWWDYQWIYYQLRFKKLSIVPGLNLVSNIGFNNEGHHTIYDFLPGANIPIKELIAPFNAVPKVVADMYYEEEHVKKVWQNHKRMPLMFFVKMYIKQKVANIFLSSN